MGGGRRLLAAGVVLAALGVGAAPAGAPRLLPGARVRVVLRYAGCPVARIGEGPVPVGLVGMDRAEVARQFVHTEVVSLTPDRLVLERVLPGCPGDVVTVTERDGRVVVRAGRPGDLGAVVAVTDIPVRGLSRADRLRLAAGIVTERGRWREVVAAWERPGDGGRE